jgi:hypothetical protein
MSQGPQAAGVVCNHCGAALDVAPETRFATCSYCGRKLQIHRSDSAVYTEVIESIDQRTQQIASDVSAIRRHSELEALDRQWMAQREQYLVSSRHGARSEPSAAGSLIGAILAGVFGIFWIGATTAAGAPGFFPVFGVIFVLAAAAMAVNGIVRASRYRTAEAEYLQQRQALLGQNRTPDQR